MRVLLNHEDCDHGAVAVIVALLSVVIFGLAAFAVDFGMAYTSKRNLQKGADAAALSAAKEVIQRSAVTSTCEEIVSRYNANTDGFATQVGTAADIYATANRKDATRQLLELRCSADGKSVEVVYEARGTTPTLFGGIFGQDTDYVAARRAVADAFVPAGGLGLRPYALCASDLVKLQNPTSTAGWVRIKYPSDTPDVCADFAGNWYTTDCPLDANNGTLTENTARGCRSEVSIIEPIPPATTVDRIQVASACTDLSGRSPAACLGSNPGNLTDQPTVNEWEKLLASPGLTVPVFNTEWATWAADDVAACRSAGNNACYPIQAIAGVKVCAFKWNSKEGVDAGEAVVGSPCNGVATDLNNILAATPKDNDNYLWLKLTSVQITGSSKPSGCSIGDDTCDAGSRGTRLVE